MVVMTKVRNRVLSMTNMANSGYCVFSQPKRLREFFNIEIISASKCQNLCQSLEIAIVR